MTVTSSFVHWIPRKNVESAPEGQALLLADGGVQRDGHRQVHERACDEQSVSRAGSHGSVLAYDLAVGCIIEFEPVLNPHIGLGRSDPHVQVVPFSTLRAASRQYAALPGSGA